MKNKIVYIGCRRMGFECLEALIKTHRSSLSHIFTFHEDLKEKIAGFYPFDDLCNKNSLPLTKVTDINSEVILKTIKTLSPDLIIQMAWTQIFKNAILEIPRHGCVGFHSSLLPDYQGGSPVNWGIIKGETKWGITMFYMSENVDTGDIIDQIPFDITMNDTCKTVYDKATGHAKDLLVKHIPSLVKGKVKTRRQDEYAKSLQINKVKRRKPEDGLIDWSKTSLEIYNWIRALTHPYPGAFSYFSGRKFYVWESEAVIYDDPPHTSPGIIIGPMYGTRDVNDSGIAVSSKNGILILKNIQFENGDPLSGSDISKAFKKGDKLG